MTMLQTETYAGKPDVSICSAINLLEANMLIFRIFLKHSLGSDTSNTENDIVTIMYIAHQCLQTIYFLWLWIFVMIVFKFGSLGCLALKTNNQ